MIKINLMTLKNIATILIGLMFCFCLLSKQSLQSYPVNLDAPIVHADAIEEASVDDALSASDDFIVLPFSIVLPILFLVLPVFFSRHYSPPTISTPKRPPSL